MNIKKLLLVGLTVFGLGMLMVFSTQQTDMFKGDISTPPAETIYMAYPEVELRNLKQIAIDIPIINTTASDRYVRLELRPFAQTEAQYNTLELNADSFLLPAQGSTFAQIYILRPPNSAPENFRFTAVNIDSGQKIAETIIKFSKTSAQGMFIATPQSRGGEFIVGNNIDDIGEATLQSLHSGISFENPMVGLPPLSTLAINPVFTENVYGLDVNISDDQSKIIIKALSPDKLQ